ncbi:MAG: PD40 domain-containing protein [Anaerolineales bacterium]|nr:PD40 domain-containing protein [Anaerolineales bacterium]
MRSKPKRLHKRHLLIALLLASLPALVTAADARAHPLDMFFFAHEVHLTPQKIEVYTTVRPGPLMALSEWYQLDTNLNGEISPKENTNWANARVGAFSLVLEGAGELPLTMISVGWPSSAEAVQLGRESFQFAARAEWPTLLGTGSAARRLEIHFQYEEARSINWYYLHGEEGIAFETPEQNNGRLSVDLSTGSGLFSPAAGLTYWDSGSPTLGSPEGSSPADPADSRSTTDVLTGLVRSQESSAAFYLGAFLITLVLGSIHAFTPGHGKTLTAAYLLGERGTVKHAFALGGIVTATHTGSVLLFGLLTLVVSQFIVPADLFPYLELLSGLLIVALALGLIRPRWRGYRRVKQAREQASAPIRRPEPGAATEGSSAKRIMIHRNVESRPYDELLPGASRPPAAEGGATRRLLLLLGISGGLVPCPDAVAILLVAVAINRILLGLGLVATFSLGMATVLILIGLAVVRGRRWLGRFDAFSRVAPILPVISAGIILGMGLIITADTVLRYRLPATVPFGAARTPPPAAAPPAFDFSQAGLLYLAPDDHGLIQIHLQSPIGREPHRITSAPQGVLDYRLSPDRTHIGFASAGPEGSGVWILPVPDGEAQLAVNCGEAFCSNAVWTPDGGHLIYERTEPNTVSAVPTLWSYALEDGTARTVFQDPQIPGYTASWSPDGDWLSYWSFPGSPTIELYNLRTGERDSIFSQTGLAAAWSPDGASLLVTDMVTTAARTVSHLFRYDLEDGSLTDLSLQGNIEDYSGSWSPDGGWLAVIRRETTELIPAGTQIWLMRPDGSEAHPATEIPRVFHTGLHWSPDGRYLLLQQMGMDIEHSQREIWLLDTQTGEYTRLVDNGYQPGWSP